MSSLETLFKKQLDLHRKEQGKLCLTDTNKSKQISERLKRANELRRAATRTFIGEQQKSLNKSSALRQLHASGLLVSKERVDINTAYPVSSVPLIKTVTTIKTAKKWRKQAAEHKKPPEKYTTRLDTFVKTLSKRNSSAPTKRRPPSIDDDHRDQFRNCRLNANLAPSRVSYNGQLMSARYELSDASISSL